jgi:hypothetical protein
VKDLPGTPAFYRVYPRSIEPQTFSQVLLDVKGAKAGFGKSLTTTGKLRVSAGSSGQFLGKSLWAWKIESIGASVIWEDEDNFVNICINDSKEIRSSGGRLYCRFDSFEFYKITLLDITKPSRPKPPPPPPPPPPPTVEPVPVLDSHMSSSQACTDRVQAYPLAVPRAHLCVFVGAFVQNHPFRIEWVLPTGAIFPVTGTITPGYPFWDFWLDFGANTQRGTWTARFLFDNKLHGQVSFQRI